MDTEKGFEFPFWIILRNIDQRSHKGKNYSTKKSRLYLLEDCKFLRNKTEIIFQFTHKSHLRGHFRAT